MRMPRVRFSVRRMMALVVFVALATALAVQSARLARRESELARLEALPAKYRRAVDREKWAERMHAHGYLPEARVESEVASLRKAAGDLGIPD